MNQSGKGLSGLLDEPIGSQEQLGYVHTASEIARQP